MHLVVGLPRADKATLAERIAYEQHIGYTDTDPVEIHHSPQVEQ